MSQFCTKCGAENRDEARFCHACGNVLETPIGDQSVPTSQESKVGTSEPILTEKEATFKEFFFSTKGRVGRKEYFFRWFMPYLSSLIVLTILSNVLQMQQVDSGIVLFANFAILLLIAVFLVAQILVGIKRLHDINASGWWSLLWLVPLANFVLLLVLFFKGTSSEASQRSGMKTGCYTQTPMRWGLFGMQLLLTIVLVPFLMLTNLLVKAEEKDQVNSISSTSSEEKIGVSSLGDLALPVVKQSKLFPIAVMTSAHGKKYGFIDQQGDWVVEPIYDDARSFHDGLAAVKSEQKYGFINTNGDLVIPPVHDSSYSNFSEGLVIVGSLSSQRFIDKNGNFINDKTYGYARDFSDGLAVVSNVFGGEQGYIDKRGNWVVQPVYDMAYDFNEGVAAVRLGNKWGYISKNGNIVIQPLFDDVKDFNEGLASVMVEKKWGFIDKKGRWIIHPTFDKGSAFYDGIASAQIGNKCGFISPNGSFVIQPIYDGCGDFSEGLASIKFGGKVGFIDRTGKIVIQPLFDRVEAFRNGLSRVKLNGVDIYINMLGNLIEPKPYQQ